MNQSYGDLFDLPIIPAVVQKGCRSGAVGLAGRAGKTDRPSKGREARTGTFHFSKGRGTPGEAGRGLPDRPASAPARATQSFLRYIEFISVELKSGVFGLEYVRSVM